MARVQGLLADEQRELAALGKGIAREQDSARHAGESLWQELRRLEADGTEWAALAIDALGMDGCRSYMTRVFKEDRGSVAVAWNGEVVKVDVPMRYGVREHNDDGTPVNGYTMPLWTDLSWDSFTVRVVGALRDQRDVLSQKVKAMQSVLTLRERFPESQTPGEACQLAGVDPRSFALDEIAS